MLTERTPMTAPGWAVETAVELMGEALFNFSGRMKMAGVFAAGSELTDANAASYERVVSAWQKLTDTIERSKLPTWDHYAEEPVTSDMVPRDVAESWKAKAENYQQERAELLADISDMMANHVDNWPSPKKLKTAIALIDKTLRASRDEATAATELARLCVSREEYQRVCEALEPFALMLEEGVVKPRPGSATYATIITCIEYFQRARAALKDRSKEAGDGD